MDREKIMKAAELLRAGKLVAFPTETVYGLGADASNPEALQKIFKAKGRPADHPIIVHLKDASQLPEWVAEIPDNAARLAKEFWPGPLTLILKKASHVDDLITGGQDTIGVRVPKHDIAQALLQTFGGALAAPSANRYGRISPTTAAAVHEELGSAVDMVLEGGQCEVGLESTIVDMTGEHPAILRPGMITSTQIAAVLNQEIATQKKNSPRVSGSLESHYAPITRMRIVHAANIQAYLQDLPSHSLPMIVLSFSDLDAPQVRMPQSPREYAHDLYRVLREADQGQFKQIIVEAVPNTPEWDAIRDRLQRAAFIAPEPE